jgi:hypothetical protein
MSRAYTQTILATALAAGLAVTSLGVVPAFAGNFEFLAAPEITLNRVYRINRSTGEISACQYGLKEGNQGESLGETLCYPSGTGAGPQGPGEYGMVTSRHTKESGVFRVNKSTGKMSICFVLEDKVVCTPAG